MPRSPITRRDDAALPHETVPLPEQGVLDRMPQQQPFDDGADGNTTPNGGI